MPPELLILAPSPSAAVNAQLEQQYTCHHAWQVPADERHAWLAERAPGIRAVVTTGALGLSDTDMALLPHLEIIAVNGVGLDGVALDQARAEEARAEEAHRNDREQAAVLSGQPKDIAD